MGVTVGCVDGWCVNRARVFVLLLFQLDWFPFNLTLETVEGVPHVYYVCL